MECQDRELQLTCGITERVAPCPDDGNFHCRLPTPVQDALAAAGKTVSVVLRRNLSMGPSGNFGRFADRAS